MSKSRKAEVMIQWMKLKFCFPYVLTSRIKVIFHTGVNLLYGYINSYVQLQYPTITTII